MKKLILLSVMYLSLATSSSFSQKPFVGWNAVVDTQFIYQPGEVSFPSCHASTIVETAEGLLVAWFGGTREKASDVSIWLSRFRNGGWTTPEEVANGKQSSDQRFPTWNPVLFNTGKKIFLFYKVGPSPRKWWGEVIYSLDNGKTWSSPEKLPKGILGPIKDKPVLLPNGWILSPSSTEDHGWRVHIEISKDMGNHWSATPPLNDPEQYGLIQPTLLIHPTQIQMLCRSRNGEIITSWSENNGQSWDIFQPTGLPNPNSGIDAVTLQNGTQLLVYNHQAPATGETWGDRNILNVAVSNDGIDWNAAILLENDPDKDGEYSYPAVIQTRDGMVHITYTWNRRLIKHVVIDPGRIKPKPFNHGKWPDKD